MTHPKMTHPKIAIVDYGAGNLNSVKKAFDYLGADVTVTTRPEALAAAEKIVLPGVGHFSALSELDKFGLRDALLQAAAAGKPFLGICLGLQGLFESSAEAPGQPGLGIFPGSVERFNIDARVPHMGWNQLDLARPSRLLKGLPDRPHVYFAHSYYVPVVEQTVATCTYSIPYTAVLESGNTFGVQCHPEKSGPLGLAIVRNFVELN